MALPTSGKSTVEAFEEGTYTAKLVGLRLGISTEYESEKQFENGLRYQSAELVWDIDGETFNDSFIKVSMSERAKFYKRLSALYGRKLKSTDTLEWVLGSEVTQDNTLDVYTGNSRDGFVKEGEKQDGLSGTVKDLKINGESIIGASCFLELSVNAAGYNRAPADAASAMPKAMREAKKGGDVKAVSAAPEGVPE